MTALSSYGINANSASINANSPNSTFPAGHGRTRQLGGFQRA